MEFDLSPIIQATNPQLAIRAKGGEGVTYAVFRRHNGEPDGLTSHLRWILLLLNFAEP